MTRIPSGARQPARPPVRGPGAGVVESGPVTATPRSSDPAAPRPLGPSAPSDDSAASKTCRGHTT